MWHSYRLTLLLDQQVSVIKTCLHGAGVIAQGEGVGPPAHLSKLFAHHPRAAALWGPLSPQLSCPSDHSHCLPEASRHPTGRPPTCVSPLFLVSFLLCIAACDNFMVHVYCRAVRCCAGRAHLSFPTFLEMCLPRIRSQQIFVS